MATAPKELLTVSNPPLKVTLVMNKEEAEALLAVVGKVGGTPDTTRRKYISPIYHALFDLGLHCEYSDLHVHSAGLWFV